MCSVVLDLVHVVGVVVWLLVHVMLLLAPHLSWLFVCVCVGACGVCR